MTIFEDGKSCTYFQREWFDDLYLEFDMFTGKQTLQPVGQPDCAVKFDAPEPQ